MQAVVISTVLVVMFVSFLLLTHRNFSFHLHSFSEIIPQSVCSRFGLAIGSAMVWPVQILIWAFVCPSLQFVSPVFLTKANFL